jgi:hypothetical protein
MGDYKGWYRLTDVRVEGEGALAGSWLDVGIEWTDEEGDELDDQTSAFEPAGWDGSEPDEYERLERSLCERNGFAFDPAKFDLRGEQR